MKKPMRVNKLWFTNLLKQKGISQREVAKTLKLDPSLVTFVFNGKRKLKLEEAPILAELLSVPLEAVLENMGIKLPEQASKKAIQVSGWLDENLTTRWDFPKSNQGRDMGSRSVPNAFPGRDALVLRIVIPEGKYAGLDGALVYFEQRKGKAKVDLECLGKISMVKVAGDPDKTYRLRVLKRGYASGRFHLMNLAGEVIESDVFVEASVPVLGLVL